MPTLAAALWLFVSLAPPQVLVRGVVEDVSGAKVAGALIAIDGSAEQARTGADGVFTLNVPGGAAVRLVISAPGFTERDLIVPAGTTGPVRIVLAVRGISETLTVTGAPGDGSRMVTPASVTVIDAAAIATSAPLALDDLLRSVPGFSLFRRSSSRVANPTTQGVTLRGMAASGASRATVLVDEEPMTDAFGGWIQWNRMPSAALSRVEVARGGASDVFGGDAVGGGISLATARGGLRLFMDAGSHGTARVSGFAGRRFGRFGLRGGAERFTTDGYVIVAPESAGPIDTPADSRHTTAYGGVDGVWPRVTADLTAGYVDESRGNGTPFQVNSTATWHAGGRVAAPIGSGALTARAHGAGTDYEQTFSAVLAGRAGERPTSAQRVESSSAGFSIDWLQPWRRATLLLAVSGRGARADLVDQPLSTPVPVPPAALGARQGSTAIAAQLSWPVTPRVLVAAGLRGERWTSRREGEPSASTMNAGPRASVVYQHTPALSFRASVQSGYRFPTINELHRAFRVGNALTQANADLQPEESIGVEGSVLYRRGPVTTRVAAFATAVEDAIVNVTIQSTPSLILRQRQNAASIRARGVDVEVDVRVARTLLLTGSTAYVASTFGSGAGLDGLRVPQVPRLQASAGAQATWAAASASVEWRFTSAQFDDDRNRFLLERAGMVNARAGWRPRRGLEVFAAVENAFDEEQDVGRTPIRTIGLPRTARVGLRLIR